MKLSEFKAWFEGFTETMDGPPSLKQWKRIQARVKEITGDPITERVFVDRYLPSAPYYRDYYRSICWNGQGAASSLSANNTAAAAGSINQVGQASNFNSHAAMKQLGAQEHAALA